MVEKLRPGEGRPRNHRGEGSDPSRVRLIPRNALGRPQEISQTVTLSDFLHTLGPSRVWQFGKVVLYLRRNEFQVLAAPGIRRGSLGDSWDRLGG